MSLPNRALTLRQPWAWLVVAGFKPIENRPMRTSWRGDLLIHAGKTMDEGAYETMMRGYHPVTMHELENDLGTAFQNAEMLLGGIIGVVSIDDCVQQSDSEWFVGPHGYVVSNPRPLAFMPCRGMNGFFPMEYVAPGGA